MFGKKKDNRNAKKGNGKQPEPKKTAKPAATSKAPAEPKKADKPKTIHLQGIYGQHPAVKASELKPGDITVWNGGYTEKVIALEPSKSGKTVKACRDRQHKGARRTEKKRLRRKSLRNRSLRRIPQRIRYRLKSPLRLNCRLKNLRERNMIILKTV